MKKLLAMLLIMMMVFTFAACGGDKAPSGDDGTQNDEGKIDAEEILEEALQDAEDLDSFSVEAVEYYFAKVLGMKLSAIEPDWEWKVEDYGAYSNCSTRGTITFTKTDGEVDDEMYLAWLEKAMKATASIAQDNRNVIGYEFVGEGENALDPVTAEDVAASGFLQGWAFLFDDKMMAVYTTKESNGVGFDIGAGMQMSWDDYDAYMEEHADEIEEALKDFAS